MSVHTYVSHIIANVYERKYVCDVKSFNKKIKTSKHYHNFEIVLYKRKAYYVEAL